jgi:GMP synthase-like glutamine amidotransferase
VTRLHCIQHVPFETPARVAVWAAARGIDVAITRVFEEEPLPGADDLEALVLMGGPMSVHDEGKCPWLISEKRLVEDMLNAGKPVLGVCLGAQIIAAVLGARVRRNRFQEIGWYRVEATGAGREHPHFAIPAEFVPFHWHGETFDLPREAVQLARSAACEQQAFAWRERVLALQFHLEVTADGVDALITHCADDIGTGPYVQAPNEMLAAADRFAAAHTVLEGLLDNWKEAADVHPE